MKPGDTINLKTGQKARVIRVGTSDFIGDPYPVYFQYVENGKAVNGWCMSDELKAKKEEGSR